MEATETPPTRPATFNNLLPGQTVRYLVPNGRGRNGQEWAEKRGRVVMAFPTHAVVNAGGAHGTPGVVTERNFVALVPGKRKGGGFVFAR